MDHAISHELRGQDIARRIHSYLETQPHGCDTIEGIAKWWLMGQQLSESIGDVQQALERLKDQGIIEERMIAGNRTRYYVDRSEILK